MEYVEGAYVVAHGGFIQEFSSLQVSKARDKSFSNATIADAGLPEKTDKG